MTRFPAFFLACVSFSFLASSFCAQGAEPKVQVSDFGKTADGASIHRYVLTNSRGVEAVVISYGATLVSLKVPDRNGKIADVVLGYDNLEGYEQGKAYFGGTIGRYGNRIAKGDFSLDGTQFHLPVNDGPNSLHGGTIGFNKRVWTAIDRSRTGAEVLELSYTSPDGEEGYPGTLRVKVTYTLPANSNELRIDYAATTDRDTVLNLTNHSYFNLSGDMRKDILSNELLLRAREFTPVDSTLIPTGELRDVHGTPFDFTKLTAIGARINNDDEQLRFGKGYDHNWVLEKTGKGGLRLAAEVFEPTSGRVMEVLTTQPGIQFYTGNFLDGTAIGKGGIAYAHRTGLCLETQHFPDSPNHPKFPSTELKAGQTFRSTTVLRFSTRSEPHLKEKAK
ncbi:MAG: aldose epimerase family protein [Candidatus Acidiferrum sp.]